MFHNACFTQGQYSRHCLVDVITIIMPHGSFKIARHEKSEGGGMRQHLDELDAKVIGDIKVPAKDCLQCCSALCIDGGKVQARAGKTLGGGHHQVQDLSWGCAMYWGSQWGSTG